MDAATARRTEAPPDPDVREDLIAEAKSVLSAHPKIFLSRGKLVEIVQDRERTWLTPLSLPTVKKLLWLCGPWQAFLEENELTAPSWLPSVLLKEESWPDARRLTGITDIPVLRPDGSVLTTPGYDASTSLWYAPTVTIPELPAKPTQADARAAAEELNRILDAFPVVSKAHRSSLLAALLTPIASAAIQGPSPLFMLDGPGDGIGATQSAEILGRLLCGRSITRMEKPSNERQFRRQLTRLRAPDNGLVLIEGAEEFRAAASISTALLRWQWIDAPEQRERQRVTWFARSSNAEVTRDAAEGILPIRFFDTDDHVREASFAWPHSLDSWVEAQRGRFVQAALVVLRAYLCAGKPAQPHAVWQRFTGWSELIAGALVWVGLDDPLLARRSLAAAIGDDDASGARALVVAIGRVCPPQTGLTTTDIVRRIGEDGPWALVREALRTLLPAKALDARHIGNLLRKLRGVSAEGVFLHRLGSDPHGLARWTVERSPLVATAMPSLHKHAEVPDPETTWFRDGATRVRVNDPRAPLDRVGDYPVVRAAAAGVAVSPAHPRSESATSAARAESAESGRARSVASPPAVVQVGRAAGAESAESVGAKSASPVSPGSARALIPNFDAELQKVAESLRDDGSLNRLLTPPAFLPKWNGRVRARGSPTAVGGPGR